MAHKMGNMFMELFKQIAAMTSLINPDFGFYYLSIIQDEKWMLFLLNAREYVQYITNQTLSNTEFYHISSIATSLHLYIPITLADQTTKLEMVGEK